MQILSLQQSKSKRQTIQYQTVLDDGRGCQLLGQTILYFNLHIGDQISENQWSEICLYDAIQRMLTKAIDLLSRRARSEEELRRYFFQKGFEQTAVDQALIQLKERGYLNDEQYAKRYIRALLKIKPVGEYQLRSALIRKGITGDLLESAVNEILPQQEALARQAAKKKLDSLKPFPPLKQKEKLWRFLEQRGFPPEIIKKILDEINFIQQVD